MSSPEVSESAPSRRKINPKGQKSDAQSPQSPQSQQSQQSLQTQLPQSPQSPNSKKEREHAQKSPRERENKNGNNQKVTRPKRKETPKERNPERSSAYRRFDTPVDPDTLRYLQNLVKKDKTDLSTTGTSGSRQPFNNKRDSALNEMYSNQIYHMSSRYKGPKISNGYEELISSQHPVQVIYPDRYNSTGLAYSATSAAMTETHSPTKLKRKDTFCCCFPMPHRDWEPMIMYSQDQSHLSELTRYKVTNVMLWVAMAFLIALSIVVLLISPFEFDKYGDMINKRGNMFDYMNIATCVLAIVILLLGMLTKNPKIILTFIVLFAIDAFVNLLRLYSILQFFYFLLQIVVIYLANYFRVLLSPQWYYSL